MTWIIADGFNRKRLSLPCLERRDELNHSYLPSKKLEVHVIKKNFLLITTLVLLSLLISCSEKDSTGNDGSTAEPPALAQIPDLVFSIPDSTDLSNFIAEEIEYNSEMVTAYSLVQFLDFDRDNVPELEYVYELKSEDGYSPREGGNPDLSWDQFETGYLLPTEKYRTFFPSDDIPNAYNVKYAQDLRLYRNVVVVDAAGNHISFQTGAFELIDVLHQANDGNFYEDPGFPMSEFISKYVTDSPDQYQYHLTASDDYTLIFSWEDIEAAFWLPDMNKAVFLNPDGTEFSNCFKYLIKIELI
jgi:hypothetical protein